MNSPDTYKNLRRRVILKGRGGGRRGAIPRIRIPCMLLLLSVQLSHLLELNSFHNILQAYCIASHTKSYSYHFVYNPLLQQTLTYSILTLFTSRSSSVNSSVGTIDLPYRDINF